MKLAYVTTYDPTDIKNWSGIGYYMAQALEKNDISIKYVRSLKKETSISTKIKLRFYGRFSQKTYLLDRDPSVLKNYARQVANQLRDSDIDIVFSPGTIPISSLQCKEPIVFWTDATFGGLTNFYPEFSNLSPETIRLGNLMEKRALDRCKLAIYSSEWAAQTAIDIYNISPSKVEVVPFGANIECNRSLDDVTTLINARPQNQCKLLFLSVSWERKGGNLVLEIAKQLNKTGLRTELTIAGCEPITDQPLPDFVKVTGFISKSSKEGTQKITDLLSKTHFLILPSIADCTPIVFCEANSFAVPCLTTNVGGIKTVIRDGLNGKTFESGAGVAEYCSYIESFFSNYTQYKEIAFSSFYEYEMRLNWRTASHSVKKLLERLL